MWQFKYEHGVESDRVNRLFCVPCRFFYFNEQRVVLAVSRYHYRRWLCGEGVLFVPLHGSGGGKSFLLRVMELLRVKWMIRRRLVIWVGGGGVSKFYYYNQQQESGSLSQQTEVLRRLDF